MPCEHYKDALIEAAAAGVELTEALESDAPIAALRAHLDTCAFCRVDFAEEQSLFAAIDSGLHAAANAEVPPSLLPRVRTSVDEATALPRWSSSWFALAGAAAVAALFFAVVIRHNNPPTPPTNSAAIRPAVEQVNPTRQTPLSSTPSGTGVLIPRPGVSVARNSPFLAARANNQAMPEVLVPRDQEVLLAGYAQRWDSHRRAPLVTGDVDQSGVTPLEVAPIQIPELGVKLLTEDGSK